MSVIAYHPPKSRSHGHGPRTRGTREAWKSIQDFLVGHTIAELHSPLKLMSWGASQWTDSALVETVRAEATELFGAPTAISGEFFNWELPVARLSEALEFAVADDARPKQALGPVGLYVSYSFTWKNLQTPSAPSQHFRRGNWLGISVGGRRVLIQPTFLFEATERDFIPQLKHLESSMPFAPKDDYYYRLEPKKSGSGEKLVRLHRGWKDAAQFKQFDPTREPCA
jgi:hypothetical protein